jgi:gluconolactonase
MSDALMSLDSFATLVVGLDHPECVTWGPDGYVYAGGEAGQVYRIGMDGSHSEVARTGGFALGLCLDAGGTIYVCDIRHRAVLRVSPGGEVTTYSRGTPERPMVNPNYPVFDLDGNLYVSDSGGWLRDDGCIYRIRPGGATEVVSTQARQFPNGMALGPGGEYLYVVLSTTAPGVVRLALRDDGSLGAPERVADLPHTVPDGVAFDADGAIFISCYTPNAIYCVKPGGAPELLAEDWQATTIAAPANIAFCGPDLRTLVVASLSRWHLACATVETPGLPLVYPSMS